MMLQMRIVIRLKTCRKKQAAECARGFPIALVTRKTIKPTYDSKSQICFCFYNAIGLSA